MSMKKLIVAILSALILLSTQACGQRKVVSDYNYRKAVDAYFEDDDDDKALDLLNKQIDETPDHIDSRFIRARIYWSTDKYDAALRDISHAIKHYKGQPRVYKSTL
jgi:Tfp pilus assembly protein PilF